MSTELRKVPTMSELIQDTEMSLKENALMVLLNQEPPASWLKPHPTATVKDEQGRFVPLKYMPIERVEYLLFRIFTKWWSEITDVKLIGNSVVVCVRLFVVNPITGEEQHNDGIGAAPLQTDKGAGATDFNALKSNAVQIGAPAAESYAIKDAAEKFGKVFGKDLNKLTPLDYNALLKDEAVNEEDLIVLFEMKKEALSTDERENANRILQSKEKNSYSNLYKFLQSK